MLEIYSDNIIPNVSGVRKSVFYFLNPGYWIGKGGNNVKGKLSLNYAFTRAFLVDLYLQLNAFSAWSTQRVAFVVA